MIFSALNDAAQRGELLLVHGAMCHFHRRQDGQLTIREIIVLPEYQRLGIGTTILNRLVALPGVTRIVAKCPADLPANRWYERRGFICYDNERTRSGSMVHVWVKTVEPCAASS